MHNMNISKMRHVLTVSTSARLHIYIIPPAPAYFLQKSWDTPQVTSAYKDLLESAPDALTRARLLTACAKESGAWLHAFLVSSLGLQMDNEVIRVAMGLRLGLTLCQPHKCQHCHTLVSHQGLHGLSCRKSQGRHPRHAAINDIIKRALTSAGVPSQLEPTGICLSDGKRPDGATIVPWKTGRVLVWDATCPDMFAPSHTHPEKLAQSQPRLNKGNELSTQSWKQATILYLWPLRQQVSLAQRLYSSFVNLGTTSSRNLGRHNPFTFSNRGYRWLYRGAMLLRCWAL